MESAIIIAYLSVLNLKMGFLKFHRIKVIYCIKKKHASDFLEELNHQGRHGIYIYYIVVRRKIVRKTWNTARLYEAELS